MPFGTKKSRTTKQRRKTRQTAETVKVGRRSAKRKKIIATAIVGAKVGSTRRKKRDTVAKKGARKAGRARRTSTSSKSSKR